MEHLSFAWDGDSGGVPVAAASAPIVVGVVSSGNLEVLVEAARDARCTIDVFTSARGFDDVWSAVLTDFVERSHAAGVRISINDVGATPAVVSLRLDQAIEEFRTKAP